jgi:cation transport regulator
MQIRERRSRVAEGFETASGNRLTSEQKAMPYRTNDDLPSSVTRHLPPHAQDIYREAFNHAFAAHAGDPRQEEAAHRIAWAAVKRSYVKVGDQWVERAR